jgi:4-amino-4-deoxy-L-arabinose transferase-like glycosyltransferase
MSATSLTSPGVRGDQRDTLLALIERWALPVILLIAAGNFFWQLGSSSYFTDEAFSVVHSLPGFHEMFHVIAHTETTPWTYFLALHLWLHVTGSQAEWVTRFPSAVAGVAFVGATYWMARPFVGRRGALAAAALAAISPLIGSYAQETRVYIFLMLAVVISVGATVRGVQRSDSRLLVLGAVMAFLAVFLHYTALSVVVPLVVWIATRSTLSAKQRGGFIAICLAGVAGVLPLLLTQYHYNPNGGFITGAINWQNVVSVVGTPFGTRRGTPVDVRTVAAALLMVCAALAVLLRPGDQRLKERGLLVVLAAFGVLALIGIDLTGKHILITRYTTIVAPFMLTVLVAACMQLPRPAAAALALPAVAISLWGTLHDHRQVGFYAPARQVVDYVAPRERPGDFMLTPGFPIAGVPLFYYVTRRTHPKLGLLGMQDPAVPTVFSGYKRVWIVDWPEASTDASALSMAAPLLHRFHFRAASVRVFATSMPLGVVLAVPAATHS